LCDLTLLCAYKLRPYCVRTTVLYQTQDLFTWKAYNRHRLSHLNVSNVMTLVTMTGGDAVDLTRTKRAKTLRHRSGDDTDNKQLTDVSRTLSTSYPSFMNTPPTQI
jgi:hypothetical protein